MESAGWRADYRTAWRATPWLALLLLAAVVLVVLGVVGSIVRGPLAIVFLPGLGLLYVHHLLVRRALDGR